MSKNQPGISFRHAEYLGLTTGLIPSDTFPQGQPMVILTFRLAPGEEATRLENDLSSILCHCRLALLCTLIFAGCSGRVEIRQERSAVPAVENASGAEEKATGIERSASEVEVGLLQRPISEAQPKSEPPLAPAAKPGEAVPPIVVICVGGEERHYHEHFHIHSPSQQQSATIRLRVEVEQEPPAGDPECERLMREHRERLRRWEAEFERMR